MTRNGGRGRKPYFQPPKIEDEAAFAEELERFLASRGLQDRTLSDYDERFRSWIRHCRSLGYDPAAAPYEAYVALLGRRKPDGSLYQWNSVLGLLSAVRHVLGDEPLPIESRAHAADWTRLRRGYQKRLAEQDDQAGAEPEDRRAVPLTRAAMRTLMEVSVPRTPAADAKRAAVLLSLDAGFTVPQLRRLVAADVAIVEGGVSVAGHVLLCDHESRARGVPWDCTACAVKVVAENLDPSSVLFAEGPASIKQVFLNLRNRGWAGLATHPRGQAIVLQARHDLTAWELAGLRRGLVLMAEADLRGDALIIVRARAWVALAWSLGLRMAGDLDGLPRECVWLSPDEGAWFLRLLSTKDDPRGDKKVERALSWENHQIVCDALAEYLCVRDARVGRGGPLILARLQSGEASKDLVKLAAHDLERLCRLAGIPCTYSAYSTRRGYGNQADRDGWDLETIQSGLRQVYAETTLRYTGRHSGRSAAVRLLSGLGDGAGHD
ncbi:MAG: hypothetical protein AB7O74_06965 [Candidatus Nanopelagicales bacterium]